MSQRESQMLWLKDLIEHLHDAHDQLEWASDPETTLLLLDSIEQDMECARHVCASMRQKIRGRIPLLARAA